MFRLIQLALHLITGALGFVGLPLLFRSLALIIGGGRFIAGALYVGGVHLVLGKLAAGFLQLLLGYALLNQSVQFLLQLGPLFLQLTKATVAICDHLGALLLFVQQFLGLLPGGLLGLAVPVQLVFQRLLFRFQSFLLCAFLLAARGTQLVDLLLQLSVGVRFLLGQAVQLALLLGQQKLALLGQTLQIFQVILRQNITFCDLIAHVYLVFLQLYRHRCELAPLLGADGAAGVHAYSDGLPADRKFPPQRRFFLRLRE